MPFDAAGFTLPPPMPEPPPRPAPPGDTLVTVLIVVVSTLLLLTPVSLPALVDLVVYLRGP